MNRDGLHRKIAWTCAVLLALLISACAAKTPQTSPVSSAQPVFTAKPATATDVPRATYTLPPDPTVTATEYSPTATLDPAAFETHVAATNAAEYANYLATATAVRGALVATVTPRVYQSMPSPDSAHQAEIIIYDCTRILPGDEMANAYEVLKIDGQIVEEQFLYCGGLGAAGLGGLFWSENSRFFYYTGAREGWPDGGGPWIRPITRYDTQTGESEELAMPVFSLDDSRVAGGQGRSLVVWDFENGDVARFTPPGDERAWVNAAAWSPGEREVAFALQVCPEGGCDAVLMRANLETLQVTELARLANAQVNEMTWRKPGAIVYFDYNVFNNVVYTLESGALATVTPLPQEVGQPSPTPFPTFTPFPTYAPEPAFPLERYPFESPFLQPIQDRSLHVTGHGCPSLTGVENASAPSVKELDAVLDEVRSGEVARLRAASDRAYWPGSGLSVRIETAWLPSSAPVEPASESPHAGALARACGSDVVARSWWARMQEGTEVYQDYFFIRRQGQWLVWSSITSFEQ